MTNDPKYETVTFDKLKPGDQVRVTFETTIHHVDTVPWFQIKEMGEELAHTTIIPDFATIERLLPAATPLEVGEWLTWGLGAYEYQVAGVDGDEVFFRKVGRYSDASNYKVPYSDASRIRKIADVRRPNGIPIAQTEGGE